ncbi:hypothetical protein K432DRAFT_345154 [Lepidopterella palustris CBS 459.81]|uniref:Uncharacterized protein n=1 Tax=Lepidopterella palustris CBS 459.81 TaxID=1314670 RepID=A0A8E2JJ93_9PEZI|nr:hypothetical protein K432DRAFT_345154 [Lepidopterella palustris CBS 459.81]
MISSRATFYTLSVIAFPALLGGLLVNGTMAAMYRAWASGTFADGFPCYHVYSGLPVIDWIEAIQVTFWTPIVQNGAELLQARMLCASLQTAGLWAAIENTRKGSKHWILQYAPIYAFLWGACGVATLLPIYCSVELSQRLTNTSPRLPLAKARALIPAIFIGLMYPYYLMLMRPASTTPVQHQAFITFYQFSPFFVYACIQTFGSFLWKDEDKVAGPDADSYFVKAAYAIAGVWSAVAYISVLLISLFSSAPGVSFTRVFVPSFTAVSKATAGTHIKEGSFLFMQIDYIIVAVACGIYAVKTLEMMWLGSPEKAAAAPRWNHAVAAATVFTTVSTCLLGPGATVSAVLFAREGFLRKWRPEAKEGVVNGFKPLTNGTM